MEEQGIGNQTEELEIFKDGHLNALKEDCIDFSSKEGDEFHLPAGSVLPKTDEKLLSETKALAAEGAPLKPKWKKNFINICPV